MSQPTVDLNFEKELWETAVTLRSTVSPGDYKHDLLSLLSLALANNHAGVQVKPCWQRATSLSAESQRASAVG